MKTYSLNSKTSLLPGLVLGSILFCLYRNYLLYVCKNTGCQMYAYDTVFYVSAKNYCQDLKQTGGCCFRRALKESFVT